MSNQPSAAKYFKKVSSSEASTSNPVMDSTVDSDDSVSNSNNDNGNPQGITSNV